MISRIPTDRKRIEEYLKKFPPDYPRSANLRPIKIVIPCLAESEWIFEPLTSLARQKTGRDLVEVVVVVNNSDRPDPKIFADNQNTISILRSNLPKTAEIKNSGLLLTVLDRSRLSLALPEKIAGVGAARKAGLDYALAQLQLLGFSGVLACLDADCRVSDNYIEEIAHWSARRGEAGCALVEYAHPMPKNIALRRAAALYEIRLRYTQIALERIPTPYALPTIGSTIVCTPDAYAAADGMNTRKAAEDFYFLMNMAKIGPIDRISGALVMPSTRVSDRVYLGTGHGIGKLLENGGDLSLEHPECYSRIGRFLDRVLSGFGETPGDLLAGIAGDQKELSDFLVEKRFGDILREALTKTTTTESYRKRIHQWFDGLKIRQAVHHLRDHVCGVLRWREAVSLLLSSQISDDPVTAMKHLRRIAIKKTRRPEKPSLTQAGSADPDGGAAPAAGGGAPL